MRKWLGVGVIAAVAFIGGGIWAHAQQALPNNPRLIPPAQTEPPPQIISGADIGFRVDSVAPDGTPVGRIVVHQKGQWVEVTLAGSSIRRLKTN
jgi:hypothetical protein